MRSAFFPCLLASVLASVMLSSCSPAQIANAVKAGQALSGQTGNTSSGSSSSSSSGSSSTSSGSASGSTQGFPSTVMAVSLKANATVEASGNLSDGQTITDLSWASNSAVACFPATQNSKFKAKHVLYSVQLPPHSILKIKLVPSDTSKAMSLYAYQIGATRFDVVPSLSTAVSCEADYINDRPVAGKTEDGTRTVTLNATTNPYNVVVGVSGNADVTGSFKLQFELQQ